MAINYGTDRVFRDVTKCMACGSYHGEMEFRRVPDAPGDNTHKARCPKMKTWVYARIED